jgi:hypothetical protein
VSNEASQAINIITAQSSAYAKAKSKAVAAIKKADKAKTAAQKNAGADTVNIYGNDALDAFTQVHGAIGDYARFIRNKP